MGRFLWHGSLPSLEALITNAAANARQVRAELQEKATAEIKTASVGSSLKKGSLFSTSLFHTDAVKKAEDCCKMAPPPITVYSTLSAPPHYQPTKQKANHQAKIQANPTRQSFQSKGNARSTSTSSYRPASNNKGNKGSTYKPPTKEALGPLAVTRKKEVVNEIPLPLRLRQSLSQWHFAPLRVRSIIRRSLSWAWFCKPPALLQPPPATCPSDLWPLLLPLITKGVIREVPSQPCYPSRVFSVP